MSREYKVIDGTLSNIGARVERDYVASGFSCCSSVGQYITDDLRNKLERPMVKSLGFTEDTLTISMGDINVVNIDKLNSVLTKLENIGAFCDFEFYGMYPTPSQSTEFLKKKKTEYINATYKERYRREERLAAVHSRYVPCAFVSVIRHNEQAFRTNDPEKALFGIKPSKFLSRYVEKICPGITEEYALAHSETHKLHVLLTIDPNIMINCSESATFSSCFTHDGEYHYSAQRYANSKDSAMAVVFDDNGRILARNWVMISPERNAILTLAVYSSIGGGNVGSAMTKLTRDFVLATDEYIQGNYGNMRITKADESYIDTYVYSILPTYTEDWIPSLGGAYDIDDGCITYECELHGGTICDCCGERVEDIRYVQDYGDVCDSCLDESFVYIERRDEYIEDSYVVYDVHNEPLYENDIEDTHEQHEVSRDLYPKGELQEAYDYGMYEEDELTYSDLLDRWYYDTDVLIEDEDEYLKDTQEEGE